MNSEYLRNNIYHTVIFCPTYIPYMNLGVYILWLFVLSTYGTWIKVYIYILWLFVLPTYGTWIKVYIYIVTSCPTYIHVKQKYKLWLFVLGLFVRQGKTYRLWLFVLWLFVLFLQYLKLWLFVCDFLSVTFCPVTFWPTLVKTYTRIEIPISCFVKMTNYLYK